MISEKFAARNRIDLSWDCAAYAGLILWQSLVGIFFNHTDLFSMITLIIALLLIIMRCVHRLHRCMYIGYSGVYSSYATRTIATGAHVPEFHVQR